jgi:hypothetical protein
VEFVDSFAALGHTASWNGTARLYWRADETMAAVPELE